ncbi:MAG TPA: cytochrome c oxidase assembly protein [Gaiellales bacterium]|nr:cytochrome c oxidase assembly protein [Gaiellales bacterium]
MIAPTPWAASLEPLYLGLAGLAAVAYAHRARGDRPAGLRAAAFGCGLLLVVVPLDSPLETIASRYLLLAHLVQNAMIADWAPPLLIIGLTPAVREAIEHRLGRAFELLTRLPVALTVWLVAWYGTHLPLPYDAALRHPAWLNLEHGILIAAGVVFWWPLIARSGDRRSPQALIVYLLLGSLLSAPLSLFYIFSSTPFYGFYAERPRLWGLSPIRDQNLGGIFMNAEQSVVLFAALAYFFKRWLDQEQREPEDGSEAAARDPAGPLRWSA